MTDDAGKQAIEPLSNKIRSPKRGFLQRTLVLWLVGVILAEVVASGVTWPSVLQTFRSLSSSAAKATATASTQANANATATAIVTTAQANIAATAIAAMTATAQANATATAQANVNAMATATVIAANPDPYPPGGGTLAFYDPLRDNNSGYSWGVGSDNKGGSCKFTGGAYHVSESNTSTAYDCFASSDFSNFAYEVQMQIINGDAGGIIFRANTTNNTSYVFYVSQDGNYQLLLCSGTTCHDIITTAPSPAIHNGLNQANLVAVVAIGNTITLYVNNQKITSVTDGTFSHGQIGVTASPYTSNGRPTEVVYSNAKVWVV
jgi:hypothetical protein